MPPLLLDDEEAVAVAVGLRTGAGVTGMEESIGRALAKLDKSCRTGSGGRSPRSTRR